MAKPVEDKSSLKNFMGISVKSDGTPANTHVSLSNGMPISTVTKITFVMESTRPGKAVIECVLPDIELELPPEGVDYRISSLKQCPKCGKQLQPEMVMRSEPIGKPFAKYTCAPCNYEQEYPFEFNWEEDRPDQDALTKTIKEADENGGE